jgi:hypothetical protein
MNIVERKKMKEEQAEQHEKNEEPPGTNSNQVPLEETAFNEHLLREMEDENENSCIM